MNMPPIKLESVSFSYDGERVLEDISMEVHQGDFLGIIGPNGSGKTTLLKIMLGLLKPQAGQVYLFGEPPDHFRQWSRIGYVPQKATQTEILFPVTVNEIVSMGRVAAAGLFHRLSKRDRQAIGDALAMTEMDTFSSRRFNELSGGQQQRVYIARALASQPDILFLDEPATGVDVEAQDRFYRLLSQLNRQQGLTLIMISHDIGTVVREVNRIACINRCLIFLGPPQTFLKGDYMEKLYGPSRKPITHRH